MKKRYFIVVVAAAIFFVGVAVFNHIAKIEPVPWEGYPVAHAMGGIDGYTYTNSLEAFEFNYGLGQRVFEVDMQLTADNRLVCSHDWEYSSVWCDNIPTEEEFLSTAVYGQYTALSIEDLLKLMQQYSDIYIVTDTKYSDPGTVTEQFKLITAAAADHAAEPVLDRIVVQIYNDDMLEAVRAVYGFPYIIYTLYQVWDGSPESFGHYLEFCDDNGISHITMWDYCASPEILTMAGNYGIHILVHTVNDLEEARELIGLGVENIYTDYITPDQLLEIS